VSARRVRAARALVLRPEPGNARTVAALRARGVEAVGVPLFAVRALDWRVPDAGAFDALLLTSANAVRVGGAGLTALAALPVVAVGAATAAAARAAGLRVAVTGDGDAAAAVAAAGGAFPRLLHLAGREHVELPGVARVITYASEHVAVAPGALIAAMDGVVLLHSARAAARFAELAADLPRDLPRDRVSVAALSASVADAAGTGWARVAIADAPNDARLIEAAMRMIDPTCGRGDNAGHE